MRAIKNWLRQLFRRRSTPEVVAPVPPAPEPTWTFTTDFTLQRELPVGWQASTWTAPGKNATHLGSWSPSNLSFSEMGVCLTLDQTTTMNGFASLGAEIFTQRKFGFGTFEWEMMASADTSRQPVSGSISGLFIYRDAATTEIDFEVEGNERHRWTQCTSWTHETSPNEHTKVTPVADAHLPHQQFCRYRFVWTPEKIEFYRDGALIATHTKVVPQLEAAIMINHWGTNSADWGGLATPNRPRHMYVKSFKYAPLT